MSKSKRYPDQFKLDAVELVRISARPIGQIAGELGVSDQTLRNWIAKDDAARGAAGKLAADEREELKLLRRENRRLRMEREILKKPRPSSRRRTFPNVKKAFQFIRDHQAEFPVLIMARVLKVNRTAFYA